MNPEQDKRLRAVEVGQATLTQVVTNHNETVTKLLTKHDKEIYGTSSAPGLTVRLDREEQKSKNITRLIWIIVSSVVGLGATYAASTLF